MLYKLSDHGQARWRIFDDLIVNLDSYNANVKGAISIL